MSSLAPPGIGQQLPVYKHRTASPDLGSGLPSLTYFGMRRRQCGLGERCDLAAVLITGVVGLRVADPARGLHARFLHCAERGTMPVTPLLRVQPGSPRAHTWRKWTVGTTALGAQTEPDPELTTAREAPTEPEPEPTTAQGAQTEPELTTARGPRRNQNQNRRPCWGPRRNRTDDNAGDPDRTRTAQDWVGFCCSFHSLTWPQSLQMHRAPLPAGCLYSPRAALAFQVLVLPPPATPPAPTPSFRVSVAPAGEGGASRGQGSRAETTCLWPPQRRRPGLDSPR